ncbi:voltage-dependent anion channel-domain-containing protein [Kickxella alabastrina]|uniref:voltage-dependent anion channel-domain-containing protein n=1 Tax=Kickxella alabastrina TaxID=61397 RepID=UPI00222035F2|nr:voltage-dependent anion channel-domain-containing protein [Kickxella alabastrina]KAI7824538.1 voltage-dependent anion channel-domain-containing protein [Kickxella alabastrina]
MTSRHPANHTDVSLDFDNRSPPIKSVSSAALIKHYIRHPMHKLESKSDIVRGFNPAWYTVTMGTGSVGILIHNFPYQWSPLRYIGMAIALFNLLLFLVISVLFVIRLVKYRDLYDILMSPHTLISSLVIMLARYDLHWVPTLALVLWCIDVALSVLSSMIIPFTVFSHQKHTLETMSATLLLPVVPNVVAATAGAIVASAYTGNTATVIILTSYVLWGMGMGIAMMLVTAYLIRLTMFKLPPKESMASMLIPLGPLGQSSYGIQQLGVQALRVFPSEFPQIEYLGNMLYGIGFFFGLLLWALASWWLTLGIYSAIYTRVRGPVPFNLGWWALIFPVSTFVSSSNSLWGITKFTFFRVLAAALIVSLFLLWLFVLLRTIWYAWSGELFKPDNIDRLVTLENKSSSPSTGACTPVNSRDASVIV